MLYATIEYKKGRCKVYILNPFRSEHPLIMMMRTLNIILQKNVEEMKESKRLYEILPVGNRIF